MANTFGPPANVRVFQCEWYGADSGTNANVTKTTNAIQQALDEANDNGGGTVTLTEPGTYLINATLVLYSFTELKLGAGVWIKQASGTNKVMLITSAVNVTATVVVPTWSAGSLVTIPWTAHGVTTQDYVILEGATQTQYNQIFKVHSVTDANTITVLAPRAPTASPTGTISIRKATRNFRISGPGGFDFDYTNNSSGTGSNRFTVKIGYAANFVIDQLQSVNAWKYCLNVGAVMDYSITDCYGEGTQTSSSSEALKTYGPARNGLIINLKGRTTDDFASVQPREDDAFSQYRWTFGDIINIRFTGVHGQNNGGSGICAVYCDDNYIATDIFYEGLNGQIGLGGGSIFSILKNQSGTLGLFGNIEVNGLHGTNEVAAGYVCSLGVSAVSGDRVIIRNMTGRGQIDQLHTFSTFTCDHLQIEDTYLNVLPSTTKESISINTGTIRKIVINRLFADQAASGTAYAITVNSSTSFETLDVNDCTVESSTNRRLLFLSVGSVKRVSVNRCTLRSSGDSFIVLNGSTALTLQADGNTSDAIAFMNVSSSPAAVTATFVTTNNTTSANSNGFFRLQQVTNALTATLKSSGNTITNSAHVTVVAGTPTITMYCDDIGVDPLALTGLAATASQFLVSTRATAINQGPSIKTAAGWVALATGAAGVNTVIT